jgi:CRISPR-associated protein Cas6
VNVLHWEEDEPARAQLAADTVVDAAFSVSCHTALPIDHAQALSQAVCTALPWLADAPGAGIHLIHGAASGNGWQRPEGNAASLYLSRRTRLTLRLPYTRHVDAQTLSGKHLTVLGQTLILGGFAYRALTTAPTLYAHHVIDEQQEGELAFLDRMAAALAALDVRATRLLCGRSHTLALPAGTVTTRSLMIAALHRGDSLRVQQHGLGPGRLFGCGLFVPHKDVKRGADQDV